jgi:hypothetical protein
LQAGRMQTQLLPAHLWRASIQCTVTRLRRYVQKALSCTL